MKVKLVVFDGEGIVYNCGKVIEVFRKEYSKFLKKFGVKYKDQHKEWLKYYPKIIRGKIKLREVNEIVYKKFGIPKSKVREWLKKDKEINVKYVRVYRDIKRIMEELKKRRIKVAILSNSVHPLRWKIEMLKKIGIEKGKHYDKIFHSNMIGFEKPEKEAYLFVLKYFGVKPEESVFVGHDKEEVDGARKVGMKVIKLRRNRKKVSFEDFWKKLE